MTKRPLDLKPHLLSRSSIRLFIAPSGSGVNLLNSGAIHVG